MKKTLVLLLILLFNVVSANQLMASSEPAGAIVAHHCKLTRVYVNGEKNTGQEVVVYTTKVSENVYSFYLSPFKAGRMPGTISLNAGNINIGSDGTFQSDIILKAILLDMRVYKQQYDAKISGKITADGKLTLNIETVDAGFLGRPIKVFVTSEEK